MVSSDIGAAEALTNSGRPRKPNPTRRKRPPFLPGFTKRHRPTASKISRRHCRKFPLSTACKLRTTSKHSQMTIKSVLRRLVAVTGTGAFQPMRRKPKKQLSRKPKRSSTRPTLQ
ncbi:hypothetical protein IG631_12540 [Alternaria alternata]|nr:hypothetical protein IG631_12540 [Alternaria alternata]